MTAAAAIVLAAGRARRFDAAENDSKVLADLRGRPLVRHVAANALASGVTPVLVVTGHAATPVAAAVADLPVGIVHNADYASGIASSLKLGLAALPAEASGAVILLADMPLVTCTTLSQLVARFEEEQGRIDAVIPTFEGRRGNPILIGRRMFAEVAGLRGDEGARKLLIGPGRAVALCAVEDGGIEIDVDTRAELDGLRARP